MVKQKGYKNFSRKQIADIATEYALLSWMCTESYFTEKYNMSRSTFYTMIHNSISRCMVSDEIAIKIRNKACDNARAAAGSSAGRRSFNTYSKLFTERAAFRFKEKESVMYAKKFAESKFSVIEFGRFYAITEKLLVQTLLDVVENKQVDNETVELIMDKLAKHYTIEYSKKGVSQNDFCATYPISKALLNKLVPRAIVRNLVSDDVVIRIRNNAFKRYSPDEVYNFFSQLELERTNFINGTDEAL